ncbi:MAG: STAS domain-containing protein [bacterium]
MEIKEERTGRFYILSITGRLDASTSNIFEEKLISLLDSGETQILINFSELEYISSSGLRVLLVGAKKLKTTNQKISLCNLRSHIYEVFEIAGFTPIFNIFKTLQEALS